MEPISSRSICVRSGFPGPSSVFLADKFIERLRAHAVGQRPADLRFFFGLQSLKESHGVWSYGQLSLLVFRYLTFDISCV